MPGRNHAGPLLRGSHLASNIMRGTVAEGSATTLSGKMGSVFLTR